MCESCLPGALEVAAVVEDRVGCWAVVGQRLAPPSRTHRKSVLHSFLPSFLPSCLAHRSPRSDKVDVGQKEWKLAASGFQWAVWEAIF